MKDSSNQMSNLVYSIRSKSGSREFSFINNNEKSEVIITRK